MLALVFPGKIAPFPDVGKAVAAVLGALLCYVTRCITPEEAYRDVEWKVLILIGSMLALGAAMEQTGTARLLASQLIKAVGQANPLFLLAAFFGLTILLQPMSNQGAVVVIIPIAIQTAIQLGFNPRTFIMMVAMAANCAFLTPLEPSCLMVYGPGRYKFFDFMRAGFPLVIIIFILAILLVPVIWPIS